MSAFKAAVNDAMLMLAERDDTLFIGQSVKYDGAAIYDSLTGVPEDRRLEMPVIEDFQLGYCTGLSLTGKLPVCIYPRMDFLMLAMNQLVLHLDKLPAYGWVPKVIIRCAVGQKTPLDAGPQHTNNFTYPLRQMLSMVNVLEVRKPEDVMTAYLWAAELKHSSLIVENPA